MKLSIKMMAMPFRKRVLLMLTMLMLMPAMVLAQDGNENPVDIAGYFSDITVLVGATVLLVDVLKNTLPNIFKGLVLQIFSWVAGVALAFIGWKLNLGFLAGYTIWWHVGLVGVVMSLAANGVADLNLLRGILSALGINAKAYRASKRL